MFIQNPCYNEVYYKGTALFKCPKRFNLVMDHHPLFCVSLSEKIKSTSIKMFYLSHVHVQSSRAVMVVVGEGRGDQWSITPTSTKVLVMVIRFD